MNHPKDKIEVSASVNMLSNLLFWVDREQWNAMTAEQRAAFFEDKIADMNSAFENTAPRYDGTPFLVATIMERDKTEEGEFAIYDPELEA
jgi:hypothetical protein